MKKGRIKKFFKMLIFIIYILALIYFMFFAEILGRTDVVTAYRYNLVPLKEIKRFLYYHRQLGLAAVIANLAGNVIAFMPFGFCLPLVFGHRVRFIQCVLYTFGLSLAIEITQLLCKVGTFDVDDLILNTLGGILGFAVFVIYRKIHSGKLQH